MERVPFVERKSGKSAGKGAIWREVGENGGGSREQGVEEKMVGGGGEQLDIDRSRNRTECRKMAKGDVE